MVKTRFGELNTGDLFRYVSNGNAAGAIFRKCDPRTAVQQLDDRSGDIHSVDAMVKTRHFTVVERVHEAQQMDNATRAAALFREAAAKLKTALVLLDTRERDCDSCSTRHFTNVAHARIYKQFAETPQYLVRRADELIEQATKNNVALSAKEQ